MVKTLNNTCKDCDGEWDAEYYTILYCPLHEAAPEMLAALSAIEAVLDGRQPKDVPGAVMVARAAIKSAEGREVKS